VRQAAPEKRGAHDPPVSYTQPMSNEAWALVIMMLVLKIPIVYLGWVVWYAIKAEPEPGVDPHESSAWKPWSRPPRSPGPRSGQRGGPHGRRGGVRTARAARRGRVGG
jgi:hypothetical protein